MRMNGVVSVALVSLVCSLAAAEGLDVDFPPRVPVFSTWELDLRGDGGLAWIHALPDDLVHDAHDADDDGATARLRAVFTHADGDAVTVPGFAMREEPGGPWRWRIRWGPRRTGTWDLHLTLTVVHGDRNLLRELRRSAAIEVVDAVLPGGPLVAPGPDQPRRWLRELRPDGTSRARWLFGAWRAWVVEDGPVWPEAIDRERDLLAPMRAAGYDLLGQWHARWEYQLVHHDRAEWWRDAEGGWTRHSRPAEAAWSPWACFDQGRAADFDRLVRLCEGDAERSLVRLLLTPLPHGSFMMRAHPWGVQESGWSPADDGGRQPPHKLNGFSAFRPGMDVWDFFRAAPDGVEPWQRRLFAAQANYLRYLVARWGGSRALGVWVLLDEVDGMGDEMGVLAEGSGWWAHPETEAWLGHVVRWFRGELRTAAGTPYLGDPYRHPLHVASTSYGGQFEPGANLEWRPGDAATRPALMGWHWYPFWPVTGDPDVVWDYVIRGAVRYGRVATVLERPVLISEFGANDRFRPEDHPSRLYPSLYHFGVWSSLFAGHAGTAMDWDDGKEYGELRWRDGDATGPFSERRYPVDNAARLRALRAFLGELEPDDLASCLDPDAAVTVEAAAGVTALGLYARAERDALHGWCFDPDGAFALEVAGLAAGTYRLRWYDPWTGTAAGKELRVETDDGRLRLDGAAARAELPGLDLRFPAETRLAKGRDLAFKLIRE